MRREPLVDKRAVGAEYVEDATILADDAIEEKLGFPDGRLPQIIVAIGEDRRLGDDPVEIANRRPLPGASLDECFEFSIGQHALHSCFECVRVGYVAVNR